eukprot:TRINITY_DN2875_c0_g1_i4.p1 TRINITY_DN2875_c0_g1~~TRINITY_DN2875_c0_g1_i4.p1  ORF type:complete len:335 (-),score=37.40 TRINITY_DN2875_c0_g1_i4:268-1239(-)
MFKIFLLIFVSQFVKHRALVDFLPSDDSLILDEYKQPQYVIAVDKTGKSFKSSIPAGKKESRINGLQGQEYQCLLIEDAASTNGTDLEEVDISEVPDPYEIINLQLNKVCLYRREGWWTYQYCHKIHVRQFHEEHEVLMSEYFLGAYNHSQELNWTKVLQNQNISFQGSTKGDTTRYAPLQYDYGGEICDLTGQPRKTEVRFVCRQDMPDKNSIISIKEPATCQYTFTIAISALCSHPDFEVEAPDVHLILCSSVPKPGEEQVSAGFQNIYEELQFGQDYYEDEYVDPDEDEGEEDDYLDIQEDQSEPSRISSKVGGDVHDEL